MLPVQPRCGRVQLREARPVWNRQCSTAVQVEGCSAPIGKKYLLIETNEESVRKELVSEAKMASQFARGATLSVPGLFVRTGSYVHIRKHGVRWLHDLLQNSRAYWRLACGRHGRWQNSSDFDVSRMVHRARAQVSQLIQKRTAVSARPKSLLP